MWVRFCKFNRLELLELDKILGLYFERMVIMWWYGDRRETRLFLEIELVYESRCFGLSLLGWLRGLLGEREFYKRRSGVYFDGYVLYVGYNIGVEIFSDGI